EKLIDFDWFTGDGFRFAGFGPDPRIIYVYAPAAEQRIGLYEYDLERRARGALLHADPEYDVDGLVRSPLTGRVFGVEVDGERPAIHFLDDVAAREQAAIDRAFPGTTNRIVSLDRAERTAIVEVSGDVQPPEYFVFDREQKRMDLLFAAFPDLKPDSLAP